MGYMIAAFFGIGLVVLILAVLHGRIRRTQILDSAFGLAFSGKNTNEMSRQHLLRQIQHAQQRLLAVCGELHPEIWDNEVLKQLHIALGRGVVVQILVGPTVFINKDGSNPVWDDWKKTGSQNSNFQLRVLKKYPFHDQGRWADEDLYLELYDEPDLTERLFETYYKAHLWNDGVVKAFRSGFDGLWLDISTQLQEPKVDSSWPERIQSAVA